jgi:hypothetical protein
VEEAVRDEGVARCGVLDDRVGRVEERVRADEETPFFTSVTSLRPVSAT